MVVNTLKELNINVVGVIAIFDYGFDIAKKAFENENCEYKTITNYNELLNIALQFGYISQEEAVTLSKWSEDPQNWYSKILTS